MENADKETMQAFSKVSTFMLSRAEGSDEELEDWKAADRDLNLALSYKSEDEGG